MLHCNLQHLKLVREEFFEPPKKIADSSLCCSISSWFRRREPPPATCSAHPGRPAHPRCLPHQLQHEPGKPFYFTPRLLKLKLKSDEISFKPSRWRLRWPTWWRWRSLFVRQQLQRPLGKQSETNPTHAGTFTFFKFKSNPSFEDRPLPLPWSWLPPW